MVAFPKAQLHFGEVVQKYCHCKVQLHDPPHLLLNISLLDREKCLSDRSVQL